jgi:hypothetical protein
MFNAINMRFGYPLIDIRSPLEFFENMITTLKKEKTFDTVAFFRAVKEKMAKATEGMTLQQKRDYWKLMREGKIKLS